METIYTDPIFEQAEHSLATVTCDDKCRRDAIHSTACGHRRHNLARHRAGARDIYAQQAAEYAEWRTERRGAQKGR